jgi:hypothetical protein
LILVCHKDVVCWSEDTTLRTCGREAARHPLVAAPCSAVPGVLTHLTSALNSDYAVLVIPYFPEKGTR